MRSSPNLRRDAADLADTLRTLATRAHQAVKAAESRRHALTSAELAELRTAIRGLEADVRTQNLNHLVPYVVSLRHEVDTKLA